MVMATMVMVVMAMATCTLGLGDYVNHKPHTTMQLLLCNVKDIVATNKKIQLLLPRPPFHQLSC